MGLSARVLFMGRCHESSAICARGELNCTALFCQVGCRNGSIKAMRRVLGKFLNENSPKI